MALVGVGKIGESLIFDDIGSVEITDNGGGIGLRLNFIDNILDNCLFDDDDGEMSEGEVVDGLKIFKKYYFNSTRDQRAKTNRTEPNSNPKSSVRFALCSRYSNLTLNYI
jgi:hypothetical protein